VLVTPQTPALRALLGLFPRKPSVHGNPARTAGRATVSQWGHPDRLRAVFKAADPIESAAVFCTLCARIHHLRDIVAQHALDRQNDLPPQQEIVRYRKLALDIEKFGITGDPPWLREQMHEHLVAAIEEIEGPDIDADIWLRELLEHLVRAPAVLRAAASQIERDQAKGDLQWVPGRMRYPPLLLENIEDIWTGVLGRSTAMSVDLMHRAGGAFIDFTVACLELLFSRPVDPSAARAAILRDRKRRA
jgi:hypothetical protein